MVEVDPILLIAAGSVAAGLAAVALCLRAPAKQTDRKTASNKKPEQSAAVKPKKKATKAVKKVITSSSANDSAAESDESEIAAIIADIGPINLQHKSTKKGKDASKSISAAEAAASKAAARKAAEAADAATRKAEAAKEAADNLAMLLAEEEEAKKSKKTKETPEQRVARLERQKVAKNKKVEEEELSKQTATLLAAADSKYNSSATYGASAQSAHVDGWAVVEDKRKVKAKAAPPVPSADSASSAENAGPVDSVRNEISVESKKIGIIIGPKGVTLHGIQDATGVEIQTPKGERDASTYMVITVTGTADGVARATKAINELCSKGYTKLLAGEDFKEGSIEVHPSYLSEIIGKGGANIRAIQDFTGVKLAIPQVARDHNMYVKISVAGNKEKVQQAKDIIGDLMKYYHTAVTHPGHVHAEMDVPAVLYNYIIGARGSEIKHIQANFKVSVHIPNADSLTKNIIVAGEPAGVKGAEKYIQKIIDQAVTDREHAEKMADSWVDAEPEEQHEQWMDEFTHPSSRQAATASEGTGDAGLGNDAGFKMESSSASASAGGGAWGASVLTSSDGW